jgi:hypothetical protein
MQSDFPDHPEPSVVISADEMVQLELCADIEDVATIEDRCCGSSNDRMGSKKCWL